MSTVVNSKVGRDLFNQLGWQSPFNDILAEALNSGIPASEILAYLQALAASPMGMDDTQITGCPPEVAARITAFLHQKNLVGF